MDNRASAEQTARDALAEAAAVDRRMRARTRGYGVFVLALALFFPAVLLVLGFVPLDPVVLAVGSAVVGLSVGVGSAVVGARLTTPPRGFHRRYLTAFLTSAGLYTVAVLVGATLLADSAAWWIGSAVLTAVPLAVLGWQILRDARRPAPGQESGAARRA